MSAPAFVAVGHVTVDRFGDVVRPGGAALYAAVTAQRLGLSVGLLTSHGDDFPLALVPPQIEVVSVPAAATTVFEHAHVDGTRRMTVREVARPLGAADVPDDWRDAAIVLLAPVLGEVDALVTTAFPEASIGAAAQGWVRGLDANGVVVPRAWEAAEDALPRLQALFLSREDVRGLETEGLATDVVEWFQRVPIGVLTAGRDGALLFVNGERYEVPVRPIPEVDATGAGDVFAAAFLVRYHAGDDAWEAAAAATCAAALSVRGEGWSAVPDRAALAEALADYHRERDDLAPSP